MFRPNFTRTDRIITYISKIVAAREIILNAAILPHWEVKLRKEAILKMAHHSTSIEGNPLSLEEVSALVRGEDIPAREVDKKEVLNYVKVLEYLDDLGEEGQDRVTEEIILKIHRLTTRGVLPEEQSGSYRKVPVIVANNATGEVIFRPPEGEKVPELMKEFVKWLNNQESIEMHPILVAGIAHYEFVRIHPFVDGNGRTARALATLILYLRGFDTKRFFALDDYYNEDRAGYYAVLKTVDPETIDTTEWMEYFTEGVAVSMGKVKNAILEFSLDRRMKKAKGQIYLNDRQMEVLRYLQTHPRITNQECREILGLSDEGVRKELQVLLENGLIERRGRGRSTHYVLVGD